MSEIRKAVIVKNVVTNIILVGEGHQTPEGETHVATDDARIGDAYADGVFTSPPEPKKTLAELKPEYEQSVQVHLDSVARQHGYDNIHTACAYAAAPNAFQAESQQFIAWRGAVWAAAFAMFQQVEAGTIPLPTPEDAIAALPAFPLET